MSAAILVALLVALLVAIIAALLFRLWWLQDELERAQARHARPRERGAAAAVLPDGAAPSPGAAPADPEDDPSFWDDKQRRHFALLNVPDGWKVAEHDGVPVLVPPAAPGTPPWRPAEPPASAEPPARGPVHDTRLDVLAPHYAPDVLPTAEQLREEYFRYVNPILPAPESYPCCECCDGCGEPHIRPCEGGCNDAAPTTAGPELAERFVS